MLRVGDVTRSLVGKLEDSSLKGRGTTLRAGERYRVLEQLAGWAHLNNEKLVRISDPYFGPAELEIIQLMSEVAPAMHFRVATGKKAARSIKDPSVAADDLFSDAWRDSYDMDPPRVQIGVVSDLETDSHPVHDRWIVTEDSGFYIGSSLNSIGYERTSDMAALDVADARDKCSEIDNLFTSPTRVHNGKRFRITVFDL